jgi:signal transduction histidine kinase
MMGISSAIFAMALVALTGLLLWKRVRIARRLAEAFQQCEKIELERSRLERALALREAEEGERFARLEHDLRSSISVIVGFSSILVEEADKHLGPQPPLLLKSASAIQQSARKSLLILEAAAANHLTPQRLPATEMEATSMEGKR